MHKLSGFDLHLKHREEFLNFFKMMVVHKEAKMRRHAAYNIPCFYKLLREYQDEVDLDFNEVYLRLSRDEDEEIVRVVAASLHEALLMHQDDEDSQKLRDAFKTVIEVGTKETMVAVTENLDVSLLHYCNSHAVKVYAPQLGGPKDEPPLELAPIKKVGLLKLPTQKVALSKKITGISLPEPQPQQPEEPPLLPFITQESMSEVIFADLMGKLLVFDSNLHEQPGLWRTQIKYLNALTKGVH